MATNHNIVNSQFVNIEQTPASVLQRVIAYVIDTLLVGAFYYAFAFIEGMLSLYATTAGTYVAVFIALLPAFYVPICEQFCNGLTLGKKVMNLRVVMLNGESITFTASFLRWLLSYVDLYFFCIGAMVIFCNRKHQRIGDLAAGAIVICESKQSTSYDPLRRFNSLPEGYMPVYPFAADFTWNQISLITNTRLPYRNSPVFLNARGEKNIKLLAEKIASIYHVDLTNINANDFLWTLCDDYNYYTQEERI